MNGSGKTAAQILKSSLPTGAVSGKFRPRDRDSITSSIVTNAGAGAGPGASIVGAAVSKSSSSSLTLVAEAPSSSASASASEKTTDVESSKSGGTDQVGVLDFT